MSEIYGPHSAVFLEDLVEARQVLDVQIHGCDLGSRELCDSRWARSDLSATSLDRGDFRNSSWSEVSLSGCSFPRTSFAGAVLRDVILDHCNGIRADFSRTLVRRSRWTECVCPGADFRHAAVEGSHFRNLDLTGARWDSAVFYRCQFEFPGDRGVTGLRTGSAARALFVDCRIDGEFLVDCRLEEAVFFRCRFEGVDWSSVETDRTFFVGCTGSPPGNPSVLPLSVSQEGRRDLIGWIKEQTA